MRKNLNVDDNAHDQLVWAKAQLRKKGIDTPSFSDAIRYLRGTHCWLEDMNECASGGTVEQRSNKKGMP